MWSYMTVTVKSKMLKIKLQKDLCQALAVVICIYCIYVINIFFSFLIPEWWEIKKQNNIKLNIF